MNYFYPRDSGPLVSILIPSRGRPEYLKHAVASCFETVDDRKNVEVLIRCDEDDKETIDVAIRLQQFFGLSWYCGPRKLGYLSLPEYFNSLLPQAKGDWLILFNDDACFTQKGWDTALANATMATWHGCPEDIALFTGYDQNGSPCNAFVFVRRKTAEILGHIGTTCYADNSLLQLVSFVHSAARLAGIKIAHARIGGPELYGTRGGAEPYWPGDGSYFSAGAILGMVGDVSKLMSHIAYKEAQLRWTNTPGEGWHVWRENAQSPLRHVYVIGNMCRIIDRTVRDCNWATLGGLWAAR